MDALYHQLNFETHWQPDGTVQYWAEEQAHMVALKVPPCPQEVY